MNSIFNTNTEEPAEMMLGSPNWLGHGTFNASEGVRVPYRVHKRE